MADTLQIGTLNSAKTDLVYSGSAPVNGIDLNSDTSGVRIVRESFKVTAPERNAQFASSSRRFGGAYQTAETHGNGSIGASFFLNKSSTADVAIALWEQLLSVVENYDSTDLYIKWQPESATSPIFYQIRGSASWEAQYKPLEFASNKTVVFDVSWPVAPLGRGPATTFSISSAAYPQTATISSVGGTAPALLDLKVAQTTASPGIDFMMLGWASYQSASVNGTGSIPFGKLATDAAAVTAGTVVTPSISGTTGYTTATSPASLQIASPALGTTYTLGVDIDPSVLYRDDFTRNEVQLEVWARIKLNTAHAATVVTSLEPTAAAGATSRYTSEYGKTGKLLAAPSSGSGWYFYRLGTLPATVDPNNPAGYRLTVSTSFSATAAQPFQIHYLAIVPAKQRALTPTARTLDSSYPRFLYSTAAAEKTIRNDLSGWLAPSGGVQYPDSGLGGQMLEILPGNTNLFVKPTRGVPDNAGTQDDETQTLTLSGTVIPRYYLAKG